MVIMLALGVYKKSGGSFPDASDISGDSTTSTALEMILPMSHFFTIQFPFQAPAGSNPAGRANIWHIIIINEWD